VSSRPLSKNIKIRIYKTTILLVFLYECETWSLTLGEEHRLRESEKRMLRRIFGPKRDDMIEGWRELHNEELHNLYSLPTMIGMLKSRRITWEGHIAGMGRRGMHVGFGWEGRTEKDY
jgi:hypothetical protein